MLRVEWATEGAVLPLPRSTCMMNDPRMSFPARAAQS